MAALYKFITAVSPLHNAANVAVTTIPSVTFTAPMQAASLNAQTIFLEKANGPVVPVTYHYDFLNQKVSLSPASPFEVDTQYLLRILSGELGPKTIMRETSAREYAFIFTTEAAVVVEPPIESPIEPPIEPPVKKPVPEEPVVPVETVFFLEESYPKEGDLAETLDKVFLRFSEPIDLLTVAENVSLKKDTGSNLLSLFQSAETTSLSIDTEKSVNGYLVLTVSPALAAGTAYILELKTGLASTLNSKLQSAVSIHFQTRWSQFFTTVRAVRLLMGRFADAYTDSELAEMIYQQSTEIYQLMSMQTDFDEAAWAPAPYAATQYVLYRSAYNAMLNQSLESSSGIKKNFQLGDLQVSEASTVSSEIANLLGLFEKEMNKWWNLLTGEEEYDGIYKPNLSKTLGSATKAETDYSYPTFLTRAGFNELGG